jgi:hypothetical protein
MACSSFSAAVAVVLSAVAEHGEPSVGQLQ